SIFAGGRVLAGSGGDAFGAARKRIRLEAQHHLLAVIGVDDQTLEVERFLLRLFGRARHRRPSFTVIDRANNAAATVDAPSAIAGTPATLWRNLLISSG